MKFGTMVSAVCGAVLVTGVVISGANFLVGQSFSNVRAESATLMSSMRQQMTADMMHDAMRGVVYRALYAAVTEDALIAEASRAEIKEYGDAFKAAIAAQAGLDLPADIRAALDAVKTPLEGYIASAEAIVAASGDNIWTARGQLSGFETAFGTLEDAMASVSDTIEAGNTRANDAAAQAELLSSVATCGGVALIVLLAGAVMLFSSRLVTHPLQHMTAGMKRLSEGDLAVEADKEQRVAEVAAMADALLIFRDALRNRAELASTAEQAAQQTARRAAESAVLNRSLADVVGAAVAGDLTRRIALDFTDDELRDVAKAINDLVGTVEAGLGETSSVLAAIARAELDRRVRGDYRGAFGQLKSDTNAVADRLTEIIGQLKSTSMALKTATGEILSGANDLSERTTKQAATIEETSATMEQLAGLVNENADKAAAASRQAGAVSRTAEEGGAVMDQATEAMERITTSSSKISNIIGMIDDIAFQTNLLALNASVEAARAGDAGKGFAVVAVEVRRLAQSAASASADVKALIEQSAHEVEGGSRLVSEAANKLSSMLAAVRDNNAALDAIARASRAQASSIEEVNTAVRQMDEMTQHNAALVEETNAAIEQTEAQAVELDRVVDVFKLGGAQAVRRAA